MSRFLSHDDIPFHALLEPAQDAVRAALATSPSPVALVVHDWCQFQFHTHTSKRDRVQRSHGTDRGYERGATADSAEPTTHSHPAAVGGVLSFQAWRIVSEWCGMSKMLLISSVPFAYKGVVGSGFPALSSPLTSRSLP